MDMDGAHTQVRQILEDLARSAADVADTDESDRLRQVGSRLERVTSPEPFDAEAFMKAEVARALRL